MFGMSTVNLLISLNAWTGLPTIPVTSPVLSLLSNRVASKSWTYLKVESALHFLMINNCN